MMRTSHESDIWTDINIIAQHHSSIAVNYKISTDPAIAPDLKMTGINYWADDLCSFSNLTACSIKQFALKCEVMGISSDQ